MTWLDYLPPVLFFVVFAGAGVLFGWWVFSPAAERAACDRYVAVLLTSGDLTEITRAGIIVRQLSCSISRRLEAQP